MVSRNIILTPSIHFDVMVLDVGGIRISHASTVSARAFHNQSKKDVIRMWHICIRYVFYGQFVNSVSSWVDESYHSVENILHQTLYDRL